MTDLTKRLGADISATNRRAGKTTVHRKEAARETAGRSAAEGAAVSNTANQCRMNAPERQAATHQHKKAELRAARAQVEPTTHTQ